MNKKAPYWQQLPDYVQGHLSTSNYGQGWFDKQSDLRRMTVLNLYVKLRGMRLWQFVNVNSTTPLTKDGCLEFTTNNVRLLKSELTNRWNFRTPEDSMKEWDSPEKRATGALHFKHFTGWSDSKVQAHIDQAGLWLGNKAFWWAGIPVTGPRHLAAYDSYKDVFGIRDILLEQGWDRQALLGMTTWHCGARDCPTHSKTEHRCKTGVWYCGRKQPPCPGHNNPSHRCQTGKTWSCGNRNCPTHRHPDHICRAGVWDCGRKNPPCPGHSRKSHRCK